MKKFNSIVSLAVILICFCSPVSLTAQENYISIEAGFSFGGPAHKIESQMNASGFGDDVFFAQGGGTSTNQYPQITGEKNAPVWIRYGRALKNKRIIEISYGSINNGTISGLDAFGSTQDYSSDFNVLRYTHKITVITAHYIFPGKNQSTGLGFGPALAFSNITRDANNVFEKTNHFQPGLSGTAYWRFINKKVFFMSLRGDAILFAPATIDAVTVRSDRGFVSTFNTTKVNSFVGDITVSAGFKF